MDLQSILAIIRTIGALVLVIYLINILVKYLSKYSRQDKRMVKILERVPLDANLSIYIIEVLGEYFLLSSSKESSEILKELDGEEVKRQMEIIEKEREGQGLDSSFLDFLKRKEKDE